MNILKVSDFESNGTRAVKKKKYKTIVVYVDIIRMTHGFFNYIYAIPVTT